MLAQLAAAAICAMSALDGLVARCLLEGDGQGSRAVLRDQGTTLSLGAFAARAVSPRGACRRLEVVG